MIASNRKHTAAGQDSAGQPAELRQRRIASIVDERGFVRVRDLSERFGVSAVTLRSDLDELARRGAVRRVHGGAMALESRPEPTFEEAAVALPTEKEAIGHTAALLVENGDAIVLDVGTTTTAMARALVRREELVDVTMFTNGINVALELEAAGPRFTVVVTGGTLRPRQHSLVNPLATQLLATMRLGTVFLGCNGLDIDHGVTNVNLPEAEVKRAMVTAARRVVVLADSTKLGEVALAPVCSIDDVDVVVTDGAVDPGFRAALEARTVEIVVAAEAATR